MARAWRSPPTPPLVPPKLLPPPPLPPPLLLLLLLLLLGLPPEARLPRCAPFPGVNICARSHSPPPPADASLRALAVVPRLLTSLLLLKKLLLVLLPLLLLPPPLAVGAAGSTRCRCSSCAAALRAVSYTVKLRARLGTVCNTGRENEVATGGADWNTVTM